MTGQTTSLSINTEFGPVAARHNRGAPYITSREEDYNNAKLGTTYTSFITGLRNGTNDDSDDAVLAQALLDNDTTELTTDLQHRAAAMLNTTVYLAEEWRKQGAGKISRALLRQVINEEITFDDFLQSFRFIASADEGRRQVARFQDVIDEDEQGIYDNMSEIEHDDFSSDDEMREDKELKKAPIVRSEIPAIPPKSLRSQHPKAFRLTSSFRPYCCNALTRLCPNSLAPSGPSLVIMSSCATTCCFTYSTSLAASSLIITSTG